jgi:hypothetical protein
MRNLAEVASYSYSVLKYSSVANMSVIEDSTHVISFQMETSIPWVQYSSFGFC